MKKTIAIILEIIPIISAVMAITLMLMSLDNQAVRGVINVTTVLGFFGFVAFIIGRILEKKNKAVLILGILDIVATLSIIGFYVLAIFSFGL